MSYTNKSLEELDVMDDFLINAVSSDGEVGEDFCRTMLSVLLQREIGRIRIVAQYALPASSPEHRGIRMDVEIEEYGDGEQMQIANVYDMEPHLQDNIDLPRHNRFYQAKVDARYMTRGERDFSEIPNLFVITIVNYDPFGYDYMMYTIENHCAEVEELEYKDGLKFIYFYTGGSKGGNQEIKAYAAQHG